MPPLTMSLIPQAKRSRNEVPKTAPYCRPALGQTVIRTPDLTGVQTPSASVPQPTTPSKHSEAPSQPKKVLPIPPNPNAQTPSEIYVHQKSGQKEPTSGKKIYTITIINTSN